VSVRW